MRLIATGFGTTSVAVLTLLATLAGAQTGLTKPIIDTLPYGIVRVRNTGPSGWTGTNGWKFTLERTIAADGGHVVIQVYRIDKGSH